ncbi:GCN5 family acetyltransferase [Martelella endophytica]|uniref:GCN5 family acetyltransferase n=2 Tax=Martelella endophytica TaxID=1486262 RepID=A0A0D5LQI4_MAREN|nr:GNAT family protein [Martelella endophytica]AJY46376.1 GCN5 family acetyltransferase [Martelella endophytica]
MKRSRFSLQSEEHVLRLPRNSDFKAWKMLRIRSRAFLQPWEPLWSVDDMTERAFRRRVRRVNLDYDAGTSIQLFIFLRQSDTLVGGITIGLIRRGVAQMCMLGYWMGEEYAGKGHMFAALQLVIPFIFDELRLHRIEAACIPTNERSASLLQKAGFSREGLLRRYLRINGVWQDHHLYALLNDENDAKRT